jgi:hypothetical protein
MLEQLLALVKGTLLSREMLLLELFEFFCCRISLFPNAKSSFIWFLEGVYVE